MAKFPYFDPKDSEVLSPLIAGLTEGLNKVSDILNLTTSSKSDVAMEKLTWVNEKGVTEIGKLYQAPQGQKMWLASPAPVIKKNGTVITPTADHFTIDYVGGSIFFDDGFLLKDNDVVTASFTFVSPNSSVIDALSQATETLQEISDNTVNRLGNVERGAFQNDFSSPIATDDSEVTLIVDDDGKAILAKWEYLQAVPGDYYSRSETENLLEQKEPEIIGKGDFPLAEEYYYNGRKKWSSFPEKVLDTALDGFSTDSSAAVEASDTVLTAVGKLQAQVSERVSQEDFDTFKENIPAQITHRFIYQEISGNLKPVINPYDIGGEYATEYMNHRFGSDAVIDVIFSKYLFETMKENGVSYVVAETNREGQYRLVSDKQFQAKDFHVTLNAYHSSTATGAMRGIAMTIPENLDPLKETVAKNESDIKELQYRYTEEVTANAISTRNEAKGWFESDALTLQGLTAGTVIDVLFNPATISALKDSGGSWIALENSDGVVKAISDASISGSVPITASYMRNL